MVINLLQIPTTGENHMVAVTEKRSPDDILQQLLLISDHPRVFILGCGGCAALLHTGGEPEIEALAQTLSSQANITGTTCIMGVCIQEFTTAALHYHEEEIKHSDALIVLSCGGGVMAVRNSVDNIQVVSGLITRGLGAYTGSCKDRTETLCSVCGTPCTADSTRGLCTLTLCPQNRTDGPCPENVDLSSIPCVITGDRTCVWYTLKKQTPVPDSPTVYHPSLLSRILVPLLRLFPKGISLFERAVQPAHREKITDYE
jgi:hypothetical protein